MSGYRYEALTPDGKRERGVLESDSPRQARLRLREQGWLPVEVEPIAAKAPGAGARLRVRAPAARRRGACAPHPPARDAARRRPHHRAGAERAIEQAEGDGERQLLAGVRGDVLAGQSLARALAHHPAAFPEVYVTLVEAGERSGRLAEVLGRLADYTEDRERLRGQVGLAFIYPALVTIVAVSVVVGLLVYVVPQVVQVFQNTARRCRS